MQTIRLVVVAAMSLLCVSAPAQQGSITAQVLGRVDSRRATEGAAFFIKTTSAWKQGRCGIPTGATLEGRIEKVRRKGSGVKREEMALSFLRIPCAGDETQEILPTLVAMQSPHPDTRENFIAQQEMAHLLSSAIRKAPSDPTSPGGSGGGGRTPGTPGSMSGSSGSLGNFSPTSSTGQPLRLAEMRGFPGIKLSLPVLLSDPTTLSSSDQILIDPGSRLLLVVQLAPRSPDMKASAESAVIYAKPVEESAVKKTVEPAAKENVEIEKCVETGCAFADSPAAVAGSRLDRQLSLHAFGFKVRSNRVLRSLAEDAVVRFLGEDQLLITFNAHPLITRSQEEADRLTSPRVIRALLFSAKTGKVIRAEDWRVVDDGAYLWSLDGGRVLAHVGRELLVYGPGLVVERRWIPQGDLRFLRVSPSRHLIVAAVTHERHTPEQHRRLAEFLGPQDPVDEDFDLTVLDDQLNVQTTRRLENAPKPSEVLDTGLILTEHGLEQRWIVSESNWDGKRQQIVQVDSPCPLRIETLPTNLILLVGCSLDQTTGWYKIVRANGKTLLTGNTASDGFLEHADAPTGAGVFAIGIAQASHAVDFGQGMVTSDFQNFAVSVYRISDGRRLYAARSGNGAVNRQSFALSENGDRLAILSGDDVSLYHIDGAPLAHPEPSAR